jgi:protein tyrosine/serine phosphatase
MKKALIIFASVILSVIFLLILTSCGSNTLEKPALANSVVIHEPEFGGVYITKTIDEFNALGFKYGDSVNVEFSNGYKLENIPYYNGYYTQNGEPLLIAYPGYDYIKAAINNGDDLWNVADLREDMTATVSLNTPGAFLNIQNARDIHYEDDRTLFKSDEVFANFRSISTSALKKDFIYRSASPCDNQHNRASFVDLLILKAEIKFILNLSDNDEKIAKYRSADDYNSPYFDKLYESGKVMPIALNMNIGSQDFKEKVAKGLTAMAENEGPYLIHCTEGKDRTGFVCMLLEALCGASYDDIETDYMITYFNYYNINKETDSERYDVIVENVLVPMIQSMADDKTLDVRTEDLSEYAKLFLVKAGMSEDSIAKLKEKISA